MMGLCSRHEPSQLKVRATAAPFPTLSRSHLVRPVPQGTGTEATEGATVESDWVFQQQVGVDSAHTGGSAVGEPHHISLRGSPKLGQSQSAAAGRKESTRR